MFKYDPYTGDPIPQRPAGFGWGWDSREAYQQPARQEKKEASTPWTMVPCPADVDKVIVQPGETRWIMVQSDQVFAVKTANEIGYAPAEYYRFERIDPSTLTAPASLEASPQLTREDVEKIVETKAAEMLSKYETIFTRQAPAQTAVKAKKEATHE